MATLYYTAAQIASALGIKRQSVQSALDVVEADGRRFDTGQEARAWSLRALPQRMQVRLAAEALRKGYRDAETMLTRPAVRWEPALPLNEILQEDLDSAKKLQAALEPALMRRNDYRVAAELQHIGLESYRRVLGFAISNKHWQRLFDRTLARSADAEDWGRLEIYLPERPRRKMEIQNDSADHSLFSELLNVIRAYRETPTALGKGALWNYACEALDQHPHKKRELVTLLVIQAPEFGVTERALRRNLERKFAKWKNWGAAALTDKRTQKPATAPEKLYSPEDINAIVWETAKYHRGRASEGVRACLEKGMLSPALAAQLSAPNSTKSYIPNSLRAAITLRVQRTAEQLRGDRTVELAKPSIQRKYDGVISSFERYQADDFTLNSYFYIPSGDWFSLTRGQVLLFVDVRSLCILGFSLRPTKQYDSLMIRTGMTQTFRAHGMCKDLEFERGIWETSKFVTGGKRDRFAPVSEIDIEQGLAQYGLKIHHAIISRAKVVEGIGRMLQNRLDGQKGYAGRNEKLEAPECLRKQMALVETRKAHPAEFFHSQNEWILTIRAACEHYNNEKQEGRILAGLSPMEGLQEFQHPTDGPTVFGPECEWLLAHQRIPLRVRPDGVIDLGRRRGMQYRYLSADSRKQAGQSAIAWLNPELPEFITVTDEKCRNAFTVPQFKDTGYGNSDDVQDAKKQVNEACAHERAIFTAMKKSFEPAARRFTCDASTLELGQTVARGTEVFTEKERVRTNRARKAREISRRTGQLLDENASDQQLEAAAELAELLKKPEGAQ